MHSFHQPPHSPIVRSAQSTGVASIFGFIESVTADGMLLRHSLHAIEQQLNTSIVADSHKGEFLGSPPSIATAPESLRSARSPSARSKRPWGRRHVSRGVEQDRLIGKCKGAAFFSELA
jgi:hypothetical protein